MTFVSVFPSDMSLWRVRESSVWAGTWQVFSWTHSADRLLVNEEGTESSMLHEDQLLWEALSSILTWSLLPGVIKTVTKWRCNRHWMFTFQVLQYYSAVFVLTCIWEVSPAWMPGCCTSHIVDVDNLGRKPWPTAKFRCIFSRWFYLS